MTTVAPPSSPAHTVRFRVSYGELYRALLAINGAIPRVQRIRRVARWLALASLVPFVGMFFVPSRTGGLLLMVAVVLLFFPLIVFPIHLALPAYMAWLTRRQSALWAGEQEFAFSDAGIRTRGAAATGALRWDAIMRVAETSRFILFFTSDQCGYFVPKSALGSANEAADLADFIRAHAGQPGTGTSLELDALSTFSPPRVSSTFEVDPRELAQVSMLISRRSGVLWPIYLFMLVIVGLMTGPTVYRQWVAGGWHGVNLPNLVVGLLPLLIVVASGPLSARYAARRQLRTSPSAMGPQTVSLHEEGIRAGGALNNGEFRWATLHRIEETDVYFLFMLSKVSGIWLPKRTLSADDVGVVRQLAREKLGARAQVMG